MNEGCTPCACGVAEACDKLYFPEFLWPGVIILGLSLLILIILSLTQRKTAKIQLKILLIGWFVAALIFAGVVALKTESQGDRTQREAERCQTTDRLICEY